MLTLLPLDRYIPIAQGWNGRPSKDRVAIARAFVAKAVYNFPTTRDLLDRLQADAQLRRICGWESAAQIPHESTFSRAFAEFAVMQMPQMVHEALIRETQGTRLIGHIARDSTAIETRERFPQTARQKLAKAGKTKKARKPGKKPRKKTGPRPKDQPPQPATRLQRQRNMTLDEMLADLPPSKYSIGVKT